MNDFKTGDYSSFDSAIEAANKINTDISDIKTNLTTCVTMINDEAIFMGPIQQSCSNGFSKIELKITTLSDNFSKIATYLQQTSGNYKNADADASKVVSLTDSDKQSLNGLSSSDKDINTANVKDGTNVAKALSKYGDELNNAEYAKVDENLFTTTTTEMINGQPVKVTHVVINSGDQINGAPANGSYGNGLEKSSSAANRLNSSILINGSHFNYSNGSEDLKGGNNIVIVNGQVVKDGTSGGQELLLDNNGNIYNAYGKSATELVNNGVKYSFACHSTQVIENGDTSPSYREGNSYKRNVIGQAAPGEYYIVTDTTYNNKLSDTAEYLKSKGCNNAYSLDQGGSVSLVRNNTLINNPSDDEGERAVGDFLYITT